MSQHAWCIRLWAIALLAFGIGTSFGTAQADAPLFIDDFDNGVLDANWLTVDGYALANPSDTANHATVSESGDYLTIDIPGGAEHNQWWLLHTQVTRQYKGSGVYEIKVDGGMASSQQVGIAFQGNDPGTFFHFMFYSGSKINAYTERFVQTESRWYRTTMPAQSPLGFWTGLFTPDPGPTYYLRVTVQDDPDPTLRTWKFEWSLDYIEWFVSSQGVLETAAAGEHIGVIEEVGFIAGNQPSGLTAYQAKIDYFSSAPDLMSTPSPPANFVADSGDGTVHLSWAPVSNSEEYGVYRSESMGGPYAFVATTTLTEYQDDAVVNGNTYYYVVTTVANGSESPDSNEVIARPHPAPDLGGAPLDSLVVTLIADELRWQLANGDPVFLWGDSLGGDAVANATGTQTPSFVSDSQNGLAAVRFDGADDFLDLEASFSDFTAGMTLFLVARPAALQTGFKLVSLGNGRNDENIVLGRSGVDLGLQYFVDNSLGQTSAFTTDSALEIGVTSMFSLVHPGGAVDDIVNASVRKDGFDIGSGSVPIPPVISRDLNYLGKSFWNEGLFEGDLLEVLIYNRELTPAERDDVEAYLTTKYDLDSPPTVATPGGLASSTDDTEVTLTWDSVTGADGYRLYRADDGQGPFSQVYEGVEPQFIDTMVANGQTYYYAVTAYDVEGESAQSAAVPATPDAPPPPIFPPVEIPTEGLLLSLHAQHLALDHVDGDPVLLWRDASGAALDATADPGEAPLLVDGAIGIHPAVRFDGIDDHLSLPSGFDDFTQGITLFIVARPTALQAGFKLLALGNGAGDENIVLGRAGTTAKLQYFTDNSIGQVGYFNTDDTLVAGEAAIISVSQPAGLADDGVNADVKNLGVSVGSGMVYVPPVMNRSVNYLGKSFWNEGMFEGDVAEVIIYDRALTQTEHDTVVSYLEQRYTAPPPPETPANLAAIATPEEMTTTWDASAGVLGYRLYRGDAAVGPFAEVYDGPDLAHVETGLGVDQAYYYYVESYDTIQPSAPSTVVPEPSRAVLFLTGLVAITLLARRRSAVALSPR